MSIFMSRDVKLYVSGISSQVWEIPVLEGYSFSQSTNTAEVTLSEATGATGVSRRGRKMFNNSLAPVEFSFSTYARPFKGTAAYAKAAGDTDNDIHAVEEILWGLLLGADTWTAGDMKRGSSAVSTSDGTDLNIEFAQSNVPTLASGVVLTFVIPNESGSGSMAYEINGAAFNEASIDFDIEGIATINWSGMGTTITEGSAPTTTIYEKITSTSNFIQNRLSTLALTASASESILGSYNLVLTGGNITVSNNLTFLTPEELGVVNKPIGHVTGTRSVSGSLTCYLDDAAAGSADLFEDLTLSTGKITNEFDLTVNIGGTTSATPRLRFQCNHSHFQIPQHSFDDVVSVEATFDALPQFIDGTDECSIAYFA